MSEIKTTNSLGYSVDANGDSNDFVARLINPGTTKANIGVFDPGTGVLCLCLERLDDNGKELEVIDAGYPSDEFITAMKNYRDDDKPEYGIIVEELGLDVAAGNLNLDSPGRPLRPLRVLALEDSRIVSFGYAGYDYDIERYRYSVALENGHSFDLCVRWGGSPVRMSQTAFDERQVVIDGVVYGFFSRHLEVLDNPGADDYADKLQKRLTYLMKLYHKRQINISLDKIEAEQPPQK